MEQDKRVIVAFALSFAVLVLWRVVLVKTPPRPVKPPVTTTAPGQNPSNTSSLPKDHAQAPLKSRTKGKPEAQSKNKTPLSLPVQQGAKAEEIVVENALYRVTFSTEGAVVKSWVLKKYRDEKDQLLELVNQPACDTLGYPLSLVISDPAQTLALNTAFSKKINSALYVAKAAKSAPAPPSGATKAGQSGVTQDEALAGSQFTAPMDLDFTYSDGETLARKQFKFGPGYEIHVTVSVADAQRNFPVGVAWPGGFGDNSLPLKTRESLRQVVYGPAQDITILNQGKVKEGLSIPNSGAPISLGIAGVEDRFFVNIFLPDLADQVFPADVAFELARRTWNPPDGKEKDAPRPLTATLVSSAPKPLAFRLFVAPKDLGVLRAERPSLDGLASFGWFTFVAKPLFIALDYIYDHLVHNYGWAIVILTIFINLAMFPLKVKSIRSAQHMQKVAPLVKDVQERYKQYKFNDPRKQKMNQEVMELYKKHGVNPLGGCLPMVIQLPFLYGFYRVLDLSIELRHAPWILWVHDLSAPDNFHLFGFPLPILLILMVVTMFAMQKITPMPTNDPGQQRMMMIMPLMFGVMLYNLASGLVLYYLTANVVGIAQQVFINRKMPVPDIVPGPRKELAEKA